MTETRIWSIKPLDPLVLGDGQQTPPFAPRHAASVPSCGTVAGMVRAQFVEAVPEHDRAAASLRALARVWIRGPWLFGPAHGRGDTCWFGPPADGALVYEKELVAAKLISCVAGAGVSRWGDLDGLRLVHIPDRTPRGKTKPLMRWSHAGLWPIDALTAWACGDVSGAAQILSDATGEHSLQPVLPEHRVHVSIDDKTKTAEAGLLFASNGVRFAEGFSAMAEVRLDPGTEALTWPSVRPFVVLGGESRPSLLETRTSGGFPAFPRRIYEEAASKKGEKVLRLQLLTPAFIDREAAWLPSWIDNSPHPALGAHHQVELDAVCIPGFLAISGWNMRATSQTGQGAPRKVRRLVPAGSTYYFRLRSGGEAAGELVDVCERLWGEALEPAENNYDPKTLLAHAGRDGYGLLLPGIWPAEGPR